MCGIRTISVGRKRGERELCCTNIVTLLWLPEADFFRVQANNVAVAVYDTGPGASSANVDADIVIDGNWGPTS